MASCGKMAVAGLRLPAAPCAREQRGFRCCRDMLALIDLLASVYPRIPPSALRAGKIALLTWGLPRFRLRCHYTGRTVRFTIRRRGAMEGFELISTGAWFVVPPLLALGLALITKEVYSSLTIGVFSGMIIYVFTMDGIGFSQLIT